ncbi:MAG: PSD1 and planctomycete cytochrome C domain-containing protein [Planctomycetaceae bacterium]
MRCALAGVLIAVPLLAQADDAKPVDFAHDVLPILKEHCAKCHTNGTYKGSFSLDTRAILLDAGVVEPGDASASDLIERVVSDETDYKMPPEGERLSEKEVATLRRWIDVDLPWTDGFTFRVAPEATPLKLRTIEIPTATETSGEHPIDRLLEAYAKPKEVTLPPAVDDAAFLRRLHLDVLGLLPSEAELEAFLADGDPDKRSKAVDAALARNRDYAAHWITFWNDLLRNAYAGTGFIDGGRKQITKWLYVALANNKPYDEFVRDLIAPAPESEGFAKGIVWRGRVNASQVPPLQFSQNVGQVFLGINLKCASCHDSFIDDWKLADAYGLAAVVTDEPLELHRCDIPTGQTAEAKFVFPELGTIDPKLPRDQRQQRLAELMTHEDNGRLPRTIVNRLWRHLMGRAFVEPVDSMAAPAWSPELLDHLAGYLVDHDYDVKQLIAYITKSKAYQSQTVALEEPPTPEGFVYTGPIARRMTAEQFVDAIWTLTGTGPAKPNADVGVDVKELTDDVAGPEIRAAFVVSDPLMRSLGRPNREQVVTTRPDQLTTLQALDLSNGPILSDLLTKGAERLLKKFQDRPTEDVVLHVFRSTLSRDPSDKEKALAIELAGSPATKAGLADLLWAVVLLPEFQHVR